MTQRDCTAADVDLLLVDAEFFDDGQRLRRKRLVQLEQVDVRHGPAGDRQLQGIKKSSLVWNVSVRSDLLLNGLFISLLIDVVRSGQLRSGML